MATAVKKLDLAEGELIEVAGRRYEVVPDREGNLILEPAITPISELYGKRGMEPAPWRRTSSESLAISRLTARVSLAPSPWRFRFPPANIVRA